MSRRHKPGTFFLMPIASCADTRLTLRHIRVLAVVALHDRGRANGRGCTASQGTIAREAQMHRPAANACIRDLIEWGHIEVIKDGGIGRTSEIGIIYGDPTCTAHGAGSGSEPVLPAVQVTAEKTPISLAKSDSPYTEEILGKAPSADADVCCPRKEGWEGRARRVLAIPDDGGFVREVERLQRDDVEISDQEAEDIQDRLEEIAGEDWQTETIPGWASRVLDNFEYVPN